MKPDFSELTLSKAAEGLRRGDFSSVELTRTLLETIEREDGAFNAYLSVDAQGALQQAKAADEARAAARVLIG